MTIACRELIKNPEELAKMPPHADRVAQVTRKSIEDARLGMSKLGVSITAVECGHHSIVYTIGLHETFGAPELIIAGLRDMHMAVDLLAKFSRRIKEDGIFFGAPERIPVAGFLADEYKLWIEPRGLGAELQLLTLTSAVYGHDDYRVNQVIWPDQQGRFASIHADTDPGIAHCQDLILARELGAGWMSVDPTASGFI